MTQVKVTKKAAKVNPRSRGIDTGVKVLVAHARLMGGKATDVADKYGINIKTLSLWENHDDGYAEIVRQAGVEVRKQATGALIGDMGKLSRKVMAAALADESGELGFKMLKEMGAFKTSGEEVGMSKEEVQAAGGVTIIVMGEVGKDGVPVTLEASAEVLTDVNES